MCVYKWRLFRLPTLYAVSTNAFFLFKFRVMIFNTIHHDIRNAAGLSILDYCLLESIYLLSTSQNARYTGWCNAPKDYFSYLTGSRNLVKRYDHLVEIGYLEFKDENKRMLKRTTKKYYNDVYEYVLGLKKFGVNKVHAGGEQSAPLGVNKVHTRGEQCAPNKNTDKNSNKNKTKVVVSVPKTKAQAFAETIEQAEFPASFPDGLNGYLKRYFANLHEVDPQKFCRAADVKKIIKQVYSIREGGHSDEYLIDLIALCNEKGWRSVSANYLKDVTNNSKVFNDGGVMRPNSYKIA